MNKSLSNQKKEAMKINLSPEKETKDSLWLQPNGTSAKI
jgi:hypothetical protein